MLLISLRIIHKSNLIDIWIQYIWTLINHFKGKFWINTKFNFKSRKYWKQKRCRKVTFVKRVLNTCVDIYNTFVLTTNISLENIGRVKYKKIITLTIKPTKQILLDKYTSFCRQLLPYSSMDQEKNQYWPGLSLSQYWLSI